jgi:hypothetical protein
MSIPYQYILKGKFTGTFKTMQKKHLIAGDQFPLDELHKIRIHRGIVTESQLIDENEFTSSVGQCAFSNVNNIQVNSSVNWPVKNDRIYSLGDLKLNNIKINNVHLINEMTYGEIEGDIVATVHKAPIFNKGDDEKSGGGNNNQGGNGNNSGSSEGSQGNQEGGQSGGSNIGGGNSGGNDGNSGRFRGKDFSGCLPQIWKWLKWLLLLLFLILFISTCTKIGANFQCYFKFLKYERELKKVKEEADSLQVKLDRIKPIVAPCQIEQFDGDNEPRTFTYNLGKKSGWINIWYDMKPIPDRMEVYYNGKMIAQTNDDLGIIEVGNESFDFRELKGFASGQGTLERILYYEYKPNSPTELLVRIIPNQMVSTTKWDFGVECPN